MLYSFSASLVVQAGGMMVVVVMAGSDSGEDGQL
jgi:hypothetical protein